jgi:transcriptional regulator
MYEPPFHRVEDLAQLHALIRSRVFGLLVSNGAEGLVANSVPFIVDPAASRLGTLLAHIARANGQWRDLQKAPDSLVVFQGNDHYITPSWYATKRETGKVVPTWNYVMVQAKGRAKVIEDDAWLAQQIEALTRAQESKREKPWAVGDAPADFIAMQRKAIVGIEIEILDIRGKWKASQNRNLADREGVIAGLDALRDDEDAQAMAAIVREAKRD